ncbi:hypothetical protein LGH70_22885 [Hymenobacter sp. BT635]|uniref:Uncharacterized protein n=1 Tax=Hymenobacter nitidus TaxID=2880929 RepID=A0ABS8ALB3_9BACT|nr:hypothetical protein [Hymenobacter nitidus]MCB2380457.1 hypothetical protein [Hymenobacter nitidus]
MNPSVPALPRLSLPLRIGIALVPFVVNVLAIGWLLLEGTGFEIHDTPDLMVYHRLAVGAKALLVGLLLANLGLFVYVRYTHTTQAARWFGVGALFPMLLLLLSLWMI